MRRKSIMLQLWKKSNIATFSSICFLCLLIIGCLNQIKHAWTCHCPLDPSQVSHWIFHFQAFLKTSCFSLSLLSVAGKSWPAAWAGTWDDNYTVLPLSGSVAEPSAHTITQNEGGGMLEEGSAMHLWLDVLSWLRAKLLQDGEQQEISPSGSFKCEPFSLVTFSCRCLIMEDWRSLWAQKQQTFACQEILSCLSSWAWEETLLQTCSVSVIKALPLLYLKALL